MLRRTLAIFSLFAVAAAIPIEQSTAPPDHSVAALLTPRVAIAQATAAAPDQTVADNSQAQPAAAAQVDTSARAAPAEHSHALLWGLLLAIAVIIAGGWYFAKRKSGGSGSGGYGGASGTGSDVYNTGAGGSAGPGSPRSQRPQ